jgi:hypothetical protein
LSFFSALVHSLCSWFPLSFFLFVSSTLSVYGSRCR